MTAKSVIRNSPLWHLIRPILRAKLGISYSKKNLVEVVKWAPQYTENSNFYYDLEENNESDLFSLLAYVLGVEIDSVRACASELLDDDDLKGVVTSALRNERDFRDTYIGVGRRLGWYILTRYLKPKVVVETGVHQGLGACVLSSALIRNRSEGYFGEYIGTDIDPKAGLFFGPPYSDVGKIIYGDSIETLKALNGEIDLFVNDSDHSVDYERAEYKVIIGKLSRSAIILGDNSHASPALREFSHANNRNFVFFREKPRNHWYPGAGIGISLPGPAGWRRSSESTIQPD